MKTSSPPWWSEQMKETQSRAPRVAGVREKKIRELENKNVVIQTFFRKRKRIKQATVEILKYLQNFGIIKFNVIEEHASNFWCSLGVDGKVTQLNANGRVRLFVCRFEVCVCVCVCVCECVWLCVCVCVCVWVRDAQANIQKYKQRHPQQTLELSISINETSMQARISSIFSGCSLLKMAF